MTKKIDKHEIYKDHFEKMDKLTQKAAEVINSVEDEGDRYAMLGSAAQRIFAMVDLNDNRKIGILDVLHFKSMLKTVEAVNRMKAVRIKKLMKKDKKMDVR